MLQPAAAPPARAPVFRLNPAAGRPMVWAHLTIPGRPARPLPWSRTTMHLLGRLRTGPRLFAAFLLVFALSALATAVGLVGLGKQHSAAVDADHLRVLVEEMDKSNYYTSDIGAWEMGVGMDAYYLGPALAVAPDAGNRVGLLGSVSAAREFLASVHTEWMTPSERADFEVLEEKWQGYLATADQQAAILSSGAPDAARALSDWLNDDEHGQLAAYLDLTTISTKMVTEVQQRAARTAADAAASATAYRTATLVTLGAALIAALMLARAVQLSVTRPLQRCVAALRALGRKDLSARLDLRSRD